MLSMPQFGTWSSILNIKDEDWVGSISSKFFRFFRFREMFGGTDGSNIASKGHHKYLAICRCSCRTFLRGDGISSGSGWYQRNVLVPPELKALNDVGNVFAKTYYSIGILLQVNALRLSDPFGNSNITNFNPQCPSGRAEMPLFRVLNETFGIYLSIIGIIHHPLIVMESFIQILTKELQRFYTGRMTSTSYQELVCFIIVHKNEIFESWIPTKDSKLERLAAPPRRFSTKLRWITMKANPWIDRPSSGYHQLTVQRTLNRLTP